MTSLHVACEFGHVDVVRELLDAGAGRKISDGSIVRDLRDLTPLHTASECGREGVVRLLVERGIYDVNTRAVGGVFVDLHLTPLYCASMRCESDEHVEVVRTLLRSGADAFAVNDHGKLASELASECSYCDERVKARVVSLLQQERIRITYENRGF